MSTTLFEDFERTDLDPASASEPTFKYLNRSARPTFSLVREILEGWFSAFPVEERESLRNRFQAPRAETHGGAFFELYCHALLCAMGFSVELHPTVDRDYKTAPDFLVYQGDTPFLYMESTQVLPSCEDQASAARDAQLDDGINKLELPEFYVWKSVRKTGSNAVPQKDVRKFIEKSAQGLDPDKTDECRAAKFEFRHDDWVIDIKFVPKSPVARKGNDSRTLGISGSPASFEQPQIGLRNSLKKKGSKYGNFDLPYIVAVNCNDDLLEEEDVSAALFGDEKFLATPGVGVIESCRDRNGFWWGPKGPKYRQVSGVLIANHLLPWTIGSVSPFLWLNPYANLPFDAGTWKSDWYHPDEGTHELILQRRTKAPDILGTRKVSLSIKAEH